MERQGKMRIENYLSSSFLIKNGLKQGDALSLLTFNFALKCAIRKVQEKVFSIYLELDINGTHQVLVYEEDFNLIGNDMRTIETNTDVLLNACRDIGVIVNVR